MFKIPCCTWAHRVLEYYLSISHVAIYEGREVRESLPSFPRRTSAIQQTIKTTLLPRYSHASPKLYIALIQLTKSPATIYIGAPGLICTYIFPRDNAIKRYTAARYHHNKMANSNALLFKPLKFGHVELKHRVIMSSLTRLRADKNHAATDLMKEYYLQRASAPGTLIIAESNAVSVEHGGMAYSSAIFSDEQVKAWSSIVDAVHKKGSYMYCQISAFGRAALPAAAEEEGFVIKGPSAIAAEGGPVPQEMTKEDIRRTVDAFVHAARNAMRAGFDGVEIYAANGYLLDEFIQDVSNQRTDEYGGSIENRNRLVVEVAQAVADAVGPERVGVKLSPWSTFQSMRMENPIPQFTDLVRKLNDIGLGFLNFIESRVSGIDYTDGTEKVDWAWDLFDNVIITTGGYLPETALDFVEKHHDRKFVVAFGRRYVANPDLPFRIYYGLELNPYDRSSFYKVAAPDGFIDYPFSKEWLALNGTAEVPSLVKLN